MIAKRKVLILIMSSLLAACSATGNKPSSVKADISPTNEKLKTEKAESKQCVDNFDLLKSLNYQAFTMYREQFDKITSSHNYYKENEVMMEHDPRELITLTLNDKLNMICDRVKSQTFVEIRKKMVAVSKI